MSVRYSKPLIDALSQNNIKPILVMQIDGVDFLIGSDTIKKVLRYGEEGLFYGGDGLVYGGLYPILGQKTLISFDGTSTQITQNLEPDKARGSTVSALTMSLVDIDGEATKLATGFYGGEILYRDVKIWQGFSDNADFNSDYILIFRGVIEDVAFKGATVLFSLGSPDQKRRDKIGLKAETELSAPITNVATSFNVVDASGMVVVPSTHPLYPSQDSSIKTYVKINDEYIRYTGVSGNTLTGCTRGQLSTTAAAHDAGDTVESMILLEGNVIDLSLKIMLSDIDETPYIEDMPATMVGGTPFESVANAIYFGGKNLTRDYNVTIGDFVKTSGFTNGGNNFSIYKEVLDVVILDTGSYIVVDEILTTESPTSGLVTFLSQFNSFGEFGLKLNTDEVDINKFLEFRDNFLITSDVRLFVRDETEGKVLIETELLKPSTCYSLPSDKFGLARLSLGIHLPPLPIEQIQTISTADVVSPETIVSKRSINKNYYNVVGFLYNDTALDSELRSKRYVIAGTQTVPTGNRILTIEARGLRDDLNATSLITQSGTRLLNRYKGAAEAIDNIKVSYSTGSLVNIGDIVVLDPTGLNLVNFEDSDRNKPQLLMEVINKKTNIKSGEVVLSLVDTGFGLDQRFGLISPTSLITKTISQSKYLISHWNGSQYGRYTENEGSAWSNFVGSSVEIYNYDFSDRHTSIITSVVENVIDIQTAPSFTVTDNNFYIRFDSYSNVGANVKLIYAFLSDDVNDFPDGGSYYQLFG